MPGTWVNSRTVPKHPWSISSPPELNSSHCYSGSSRPSLWTLLTCRGTLTSAENYVNVLLLSWQNYFIQEASVKGCKMSCSRRELLLVRLHTFIRDSKQVRDTHLYNSVQRKGRAVIARIILCTWKWNSGTISAQIVRINSALKCWNVGRLDVGIANDISINI